MMLGLGSGFRLQALYRDNGKWNYGDYRDYIGTIGSILGLYRRMEKNMEAGFRL